MFILLLIFCGILITLLDYQGVAEWWTLWTIIWVSFIGESLAQSVAFVPRTKKAIGEVDGETLPTYRKQLSENATTETS